MAIRIFKNEEITVVASMVRDSFARDKGDFGGFSPKYTPDFLTAFSGKIVEAETRTGTLVYVAQLKALTNQLYIDVDGLRPLLTRLEGYLFLAKDSLSVSMKDFGITAVRKALSSRDVEGLLDKLTVTLQLVDNDIAGLEAVGFTAAARTALEDLKTSIRDANLEQNLKMDEKEAGVQNNRALLNELYETVTEIMDIGKRLFKYDNAEKTGDYTATTIKSRIRHDGGGTPEEPVAPELGILSGVIMDKSNDKPLLGASVEILENELLQITDEDGTYYFDSVGAGTYTVKAGMDGFVDTMMQNVVIVVDETTELDMELMRKAV